MSVTGRCSVAAAGLIILIGGAGACSGSDAAQPSPRVDAPVAAVEAPAPTTTTSVMVLAADAFDRTDALLADRVRSAGLSGGMVRIGRADGSVIHERSVGSVDAATPLSVASSTKWLTAATFMSLVDSGSAALDDPVSKWLPYWTTSETVRQLLTHTSGVRDNACQNGGASLDSCVRAIAGSARQFAPGAQFSYGNSSFLVVGRVIEAISGADFATVVHDRLTGPLGMDATTWPGSPGGSNPAFGVRVTVDDYGTFLSMILGRGESDGIRVLSEESVDQLVGEQTRSYDTTHDFSVGITKIPRYALGCWPDVVNSFGVTDVVSGNGGMGLYPWVDFTTNTWGIVGVQDERGAQLAVPASQRVEIEARETIARSTGVPPR